MRTSSVGSEVLVSKTRQYHALATVRVLQLKHTDLFHDDENKLVINATAAGLPLGAWPDYVVVTDERGWSVNTTTHKSSGQVVEEVFGPSVKDVLDNEGELIAKTYFNHYTARELRIATTEPLTRGA